jgi:hypothetical protein
VTEPAGIYVKLRDQMLTTDPGTYGLVAPDGRSVWGAVIDIGSPGGSSTLVALADNTTSLYHSTGGGIIGAGPHQPVADATQLLLRALHDRLAFLPRSDDMALPDPGYWAIHALAVDGRHRLVAPVAELDDERQPLRLVFRAVHHVLTQLRLLDESGDPTGRLRKRPRPD